MFGKTVEIYHVCCHNRCVVPITNAQITESLRMSRDHNGDFSGKIGNYLEEVVCAMADVSVEGLRSVAIPTRLTLEVDFHHFT